MFYVKRKTKMELSCIWVATNQETCGTLGL